MFNNWKQKCQLVINEFMNKNSYKIINNIQEDYNDKIKNLEQKYEYQLEQNKKLIERLDKHGKTLSKLNAKIQIKAEITDIKKIKSEIIEETGIKKQVKIQEDFRLLRFDWNEFKKSLPIHIQIEMNMENLFKEFLKTSEYKYKLRENFTNDNGLFQSFVPFIQRKLNYNNLNEIQQKRINDCLGNPTLIHGFKPYFWKYFNELKNN